MSDKAFIVRVISTIIICWLISGLILSTPPFSALWILCGVISTALAVAVVWIPWEK